MNVTIVDYNSGNISSVINSFKEVAKDKVNIEVTSDLNKIRSSDKVVLPGQGSFKSCVDALNAINGLVEILNEFAITNKKPLLGICVGLQMFADLGYDLVLIDSIAEVIEGARDDNGWDRKTAESWLVEVCVRNNKGENKQSKFTSFLLIQQVTKSGEFVGSNKLKHMTDAMLEMRRESERDGGGCFMMFNKNRNGNVNKKVSFALSNNKIDYGILVDA